MLSRSASVLPVVASAGTATAHGYNGNTNSMMGSQRSNGTGCLTLTGNAGGGSASLVFGSQKYICDSFVVNNGILMATIHYTVRTVP